MACYRVVLPYQRSILIRSLISFNVRNFTTDDHAGKEKESKDVQVRNKEEEKHVKNWTPRFNLRKTPRVDLTKRSGINVKHTRKESNHSLLIRHCLDESPDKQGFIKAIEIFSKKDKYHRGHIDFISTALKFMKPYGLEKEHTIYEKLMDIFPRNRFVNLSFLDAVLPKQHPQIFLALDLLVKMEEQAMIPSQRMHDMVYEIFGRASFPLQKIYRMWFWFQEFKDINPYKLDEKVYEDRLNILKAVIERILGNNDGTKIIEISAPIEDDDTGMIDYDHFILSSQTLLQRKYITFCLPSTPIYIEGPSHIWINHRMELYFIMKTGQGELTSSEDITIPPDEEREGVIIGVCLATKPYTETLQRWLKYMQDENEVLKDVNVIFDVVDEESGEKLIGISSE